MSVLPRYAWHEFLRPLRKEEGPPSPDQQAKFNRGNIVHGKVRAMVGESFIFEQERIYSEPGLPFEIAYHPDIYRQEVGVDGTVLTYIYETKPLLWFMRNRVACEAQASGYAHFTGAADTAFILYNGDVDDLRLNIFPLRRIPWPTLRALAVDTFLRMTGQIT